MGDPIKINTKDGRGVQTNTSSQFYSNQYDAGNIGNQNQDGSYTLQSDPVYDAGTIAAVGLTTKADKYSIGSFAKEYHKKNPFDKYAASEVQRYMRQQRNAPKWAQLSVNEEDLIPYVLSEAENKYAASTERYVAKKIEQHKPYRDKKMSRASYLDSLTAEEERLLKQYNPKYQSTYLDDFKKSFKNLSDPAKIYQNIMDSKDFSNREKREMLEEHANNPKISALMDAAGLLSPLSVFPKAIQSIYRPNYSMKDALRGVKNEAGLIEDIVTDPTTYVGIGLASKVRQSSRLGRALGRLEKVTGKTNNLDDLNFDNLFSLTGSDSFNIDELRRAYHNNERILSIDEINFLRRDGFGESTQYSARRSSPIDVSNIQNRAFGPGSPGGSSQLDNFRQNITTRNITTRNIGASSLNNLNIRSNLTQQVLDQLIESSQQQALKRGLPHNKSGLTKVDVLDAVKSEQKDIVKNMDDSEFIETVLKPDGTIVKKNEDPIFPKGVTQLSKQEYIKKFNDNIDELNKIIATKNKSGLNYEVAGLDEDGVLMFKNPEQISSTDGKSIQAGTVKWQVRLNPGEWTGAVEDIPNTKYYQNIPGLEMSNSSNSVFSDMTPRRGTGTYESLNEYLKSLNLGRVKPGFNSQTKYSRGAWENFIKSDKAVGFYNDPKTVYGSMKTIAPIAGAGVAGAAALATDKNKALLESLGIDSSDKN